jgi:integrase
MDLPIVNPRKQRRPALRLDAVNTLVSQSNAQEQALYVLLAATGMRISEALALETKHFINGGRTIQVCQQVDRDKPRIVEYLKQMPALEKLICQPKSQSTCEHL